MTTPFCSGVDDGVAVMSGSALSKIEQAALYPLLELLLNPRARDEESFRRELASRTGALRTSISSMVLALAWSPILPKRFVPLPMALRRKRLAELRNTLLSSLAWKPASLSRWEQYMPGISWRSPISIAAAVIYIITQLSDDKKLLKDISLATGVAEGTIRNAYKEGTFILNKLMPEKFDVLKGQLIDAGISTEDILKGVISLIFEKAVLEPTFCQEDSFEQLPGGI